MPQTCRQFWFGLMGRNVLNFNWDAIDHDSVVLISVSEFNRDGFTPDHHRFVGAATITVCNISPHGPPYDPNHGVQFAVQIDWGTPLNIVTDITVLDKPVDVQPAGFGYGPSDDPSGLQAGRTSRGSRDRREVEFVTKGRRYEQAFFSLAELLFGSSAFHDGSLCPDGGPSGAKIKQF